MVLQSPFTTTVRLTPLEFVDRIQAQYLILAPGTGSQYKSDESPTKFSTTHVGIQGTFRDQLKRKKFNILAKTILSNLGNPMRKGGCVIYRSKYSKR